MASDGRLPGCPDYASAQYRCVDGHKEFNALTGIAISPVTGQVVVADWGDHCIVILDRDLHLMRTVHKAGQHHFLHPYGLTINKEGNIFVSDELNRIVVLDSEGRFLYEVGSKCSCPQGLALDAERFLYVCDMYNFRIQVLRAEDGSYIREFGNKGTYRLKYEPLFIALSKSGAVAVSDTARNLHLYSDKGVTHLRTIPAHEPPHGLCAVGVAYDDKGYLVVAHEAGSFVILREDGELVCRVPHGVHAPRGLAITDMGDILVCSRGDGCVRMLQVQK